VWPLVRRAFGDRSFRLVLAQSWWLSCAQGLSQAALFKFQVDVLHIPLPMYYVLSSVMLGLQLPLAALGGWLSDRYGDRRPLMYSLAAVSTALLFAIAASPERWWLMFGAYAVWGLFGVVNVCGQNLALRLAPASDNTVHFALFRQIGGLLAGAAGLCGGLWLDALLSESSDVNIAGRMLVPFQIVFAVSLLGRATAPLWLLGVREPDKHGKRTAERGEGRD
jgi:MFS family permease